MSAISTDRIREIVGRLPTTRDEDWKYTDLSRARDISTRWLDAGAATPADSRTEEITAITSSIDATWFVFENGRLSALADGDGFTAEKLAEVPFGDSALAELNAALLADGLRLRFDGTPSKPVGLLFFDAAEEPSLTQGYVELEFAAHAAADVVEYHASRGSADHYANSRVSIKVGDGAAVNHVRIQDLSLIHI